MNHRIREISAKTVVSFVYLARPPSPSKEASHYMKLLDILTRDLPPVLLTHGVDPVITD